MTTDKNIERKLAKLAALEAGGVDNWEWYDESLKEYRTTIERDETAETVIDEIFDAISCEIEEPAGQGAGYGIRTKGYDIAVKILLSRVKEFETE